MTSSLENTSLPERGRARFRSRRIAAVLVPTVLAIVAATVLTPLATAEASPLSSTPLITYNMQGAGNGQDSKWTTTIGRFARMAEIVAVQEAGPTAPGTNAGPQIPIPGLPPIGRAGFVQHNRWRFQHESYEVYFLQTDQNGGSFVGGRNNIALVTQREADEVTAVTIGVGRAALGVRFGDDWYFSFHARSLGGQPNDSQAMLVAIENRVNQTPGRHWTVMGDFNNEPASFPIPNGSNIYRTGQATQQGGRELDFAVSSRNVPNHPVLRVPGATSDHFAVAIGAMRASAERRETIFPSARVIENMQSGGALDANLPNGDGNGTPILTFGRTGASNQEWDIEFDNTDTVRMRLVGGRCMETRRNPEGRWTLELQDCANNDTQKWQLISAEAEQYQIRNVGTDLCMDVGETTDPRLTNFALDRCQLRPRQTWIIGPPDHARGDRTVDDVDLPVAYDGTSGVVNVRNGRLMASDQRSFVAPVVAQPHHVAPVNSNDEEWVLEWDAGRRWVRMKDPRGNKCATANADFDRRPGDYNINLEPCADSRNQFWAPQNIGENLFILRNAQRFIDGEACLDIAPQAGNTSFVVGTRCGGTSLTEFWFFAPATVPPPTPASPPASPPTPASPPVSPPGGAAVK